MKGYIYRIENKINGKNYIGGKHILLLNKDGKAMLKNQKRIDQRIDPCTEQLINMALKTFK